MKDKVVCTICNTEMGYQGYSRHMFFKHGQKGRIPDMRQDAGLHKRLVPGEHPVEELEVIISKLVQRESDLAEELNRAAELQLELQSVAQLRESLEHLVQVYKDRKQMLTADAI